MERAGKGLAEPRRIAFLRKRLSGLQQTLSGYLNAAYRVFCTGVAGVAFSAALVQAQTPVINNITPTANSFSVPGNSNISIEFSTTMTVSTLTAANIRIFGSQSGFLSTRGSLSGNPVRLFDPSLNFHPGEEITVTVTGATSLGGSALTRATVHQFRAEALGGSAEFATTGFGGKNGDGVAIGDLDGDGDLDAVIAINKYPQEVWLNNGDGTFTSSVFGNATGRSRDVALGDLDGDGDLDAVIANQYAQEEIWLNNGDGTFTSSVFGPPSNRAFGLALGDLDGDGDLDAVISCTSGEPNQIWLNNGDGSFTSSNFGADNLTSVALGDLDGDGDLDAVLVNSSAAASQIWLNNGDGSFSSSTVAGSFGVEVVLGDLDGDDDLDAIVAQTNNGQAIWINAGNGTFSTSTLSFGFPSGVDLGDLDGDGDLDAFFSRVDVGPSFLWTNNGDGTFASREYTQWFSEAGALGDLDGDGDLDAIHASRFHTPVPGLEHTILINEPPAPTISSLTPSSTTASLDAMDIVVVGNLFEIQEADLSILNSSGTTVGTRELQINAVPGSVTARVPAGLLSTVGTLTLTVSNSVASASTSLTVLNDRPEISLIGPATLSEDLATTISVSLGDFVPGVADLVVTPPTADLVTIASISQIGATGATTQFLISPAADASGSIPLSFQVSDGELTNSTSFVLTVNPVNDAPQISATSALISTEENRSTSAFVQLSDVDTPLADLILNATSNNQSLLPNGNLTLGATAASVALQITPECGTTGAALVTVSAFDGEFRRSTSFTVNVQPASELTITGSTLPCPGQAFEYSVEPMDAAAAHLWSVTGGTIVSGQGSSSVQVFWDESTTGTVSIDVTRTLPSGCTEATALPVTPSIVRALLDFAALDATGGTLDVLRNDEGANLQLLSVDDPAGGSASILNGLVSYTPDAGFAGLDQFVYTATTPGGCQVTGAILVAVASSESALANSDYIECEKDRKDGVRGLRGAYDVTLRPDGRFLYVAGRNDHSIAIFERSTTSGSLSYQGRVRNGSGGVSGLRYLNDLAISPDGRQLYAAGYGNNAVAAFNIDELSGALSFIGRISQGNSSGGQTVSTLKRPRALAVSPDGLNTYISGYVSHALTVFSRLTDGSLELLEAHRDGTGGVDGLRNALGVAVAPDGTTVYATAYGDHAVAVFSRRLTDGSLSFVERKKDGSGGIDGLSGAVAVAVSPDGKHVYVAGKLDNAIAVFRRDAANGKLSFVKRYKDGVAGVNGLAGIWDVKVSSGGAHVWAAGANDNAVALFERDAATGELQWLGISRDGVDGVDGLRLVRALALDPTNKHVYGTGNRDNAVAALFRNLAPQAVDDNAGNVAINSPLLINPLANDSDPDNHSVIITNVTGASLGSLSISGGGTTIDYDAGAAPGADSFSYTIDDGHGGTSSATVNVAVVLPKQSLPLAPVLPAFHGNTISQLGINPNPVAEHAAIELTLEQEVYLRIGIADMTGRVLIELSDREYAAGRHSLEWQARLESGAPLAAGSYLLVVEELGTNEVVRRHVSPFVILP